MFIKSFQHKAPILLILTSLLLLLGFEAVWLRGVYGEQQRFLQQDIDNIFKNTVFALQDSLIEKKIIEPFRINGQNDSIYAIKKDRQKQEVSYQMKPEYFMKKYVEKERTPVKKRVIFDTALSLRSYYNMKYDTADISGFSPAMQALYRDSLTKIDTKAKIIVIASKGKKIGRDSILAHLDTLVKTSTNKPLVLNILSMYGEHKSTPTLEQLRPLIRQISKKKAKKIDIKNISISVKIDEEPLSFNDLSRNFKRDLGKVYPAIHTDIEQISDKQKDIIPMAQLTTSSVAAGIPQNTFYRAKVNGYEGTILQKMFSEVFFALFLLGITALSFLLIFRNLQEQRRLTALKNDFISNVTHELKTPITTVGVAIEALGSFNVLQNPEQTKEYLEISKSELTRLGLLVDKILKMAKFEQKGLVLQQEPIDLSQNIKQVLASMRLQFEKVGVKVSYTPVPTPLVADSVHLTNVLYNLIDNALKYGGEQPEIGIEVQADRRQVRIAISDKGLGIPEAFRKRIFERFFRVPTGNIHNVKGHGLGLSYVADVVHQHGGSIELQSAENKGSTFVITLPQSDTPHPLL